MDPSELVSLVAALNPENTAGRLAVIVRMGAKQVRLPRSMQSCMLLRSGAQRQSLLLPCHADSTLLQHSSFMLSTCIAAAVAPP